MNVFFSSDLNFTTSHQSTFSGQNRSSFNGSVPAISQDDVDNVVSATVPASQANRLHEGGGVTKPTDRAQDTGGRLRLTHQEKAR